MTKTAPFEIIPARGSQGGMSTTLFCFCDHASNHIPPAYSNLGLKPNDLERHIGWDIGSETITRLLCAHFGGGGILAGFSRLLIDANRVPESPTLIPETSDGTMIPGNQNLSSQDRQTRIRDFFNPYHGALSQELGALLARSHDPLIVSVHSFTPKPATGEIRDIDIGLLWKVDQDRSEWLKAEIETVYPYKVALNAPYSGLRLNHTIDYHIIPRGLRHVTLEIRQDLIETDAQCETMAGHLIPALKAIL